MNCPSQNNEGSEFLLDYVAGKLDAARSGLLERHLEVCPLCRETVESQRRVWNALDEWEPVGVSSDFDRRLYAAIEQDQQTRNPFSRWLTGISARWTPVPWRSVVPVAAVCAAVLIAMLARPVPQRPEAVRDGLQPCVDVEQVERALEDLEMLKQFSPKV